MTAGALEGVRVVELGQMVSAPYCAKLFADYGADVLKVEPLGGDAARHRRRAGPRHATVGSGAVPVTVEVVASARSAIVGRDTH